MIAYIVKADYCAACKPVVDRILKDGPLLEGLKSRGIEVRILNISRPDDEAIADRIGINPSLPQLVATIPNAGTLRVSGGYNEIKDGLESLMG